MRVGFKLKKIKLLIVTAMKRVAIVGFALSFVLLAVPILASDVTVSVLPDQISINTSESGTVDMIIKNNQAVGDTFSLSIWPSTKWGGVTPNLEKYKVTIGADEAETVKIYLSVASDAERASPTFLVTAKSLTNSSVVHSTSFNVLVTRKFSVYISNVVLDKHSLKPDECLGISVFVTNDGSLMAPLLTVQTSVEYKNVIGIFTDQIVEMAKLTTTSVSNTYCLPSYSTPGKYSVKVSLKDSVNRIVSTKTVDFEVKNYTNLVQEESVVYGLFAQTKTITLTNEGNIAERDLYVTESIQLFIRNFFYPKIEPESEEKVENRMVYSWHIESLQPGERISISYEINFMSIWLTGLAIIGIVYFAFKYVYAPKVIKRHRLEGAIERGKEMLISLEVRNPTIHEIKNVVVKDFISPIAVVVEKFDTVKPKITRREAGTDLEWKFRSLKPREERILTYRIKPVVEIIGTLRLSRATVMYTDRKKMKKTLVSKTVFVKPR